MRGTNARHVVEGCPGRNTAARVKGEDPVSDDFPATSVKTNAKWQTG
jgi:hypothetical protein